MRPGMSLGDDEILAVEGKIRLTYFGHLVSLLIRRDEL